MPLVGKRKQAYDRNALNMFYGFTIETHIEWSAVGIHTVACEMLAWWLYGGSERSVSCHSHPVAQKLAGLHTTRVVPGLLFCRSLPHTSRWPAARETERSPCAHHASGRQDRQTVGQARTDGQTNGSTQDVGREEAVLIRVYIFTK